MNQTSIRFELSSFPDVPWEADLIDGKISAICCCWADCYSSIDSIDFLSETDRLEMKEKLKI